MRKVATAVTAALLLTCAACSNSNKLYPVSGRMTYCGSPAAGAVVSFHRRGGDSANDPTIVGIVQDDGSFELVCGSLGRGAPAGDYDVLVEWKRVIREGTCCRSQLGPDRLGGRYADPNNPLLHATIEERATELPPLELANAGGAPPRK